MTVLTAERQHPIQYPAVVAPLRHVFAWTKARISIDAIVLHPDHLHRAWTIPRSDADYCRRWRAIKQCFAMRIEALASELDEKPICQRWFREHLIPDDDMREHLKQIQYNSVRHALVNTPEDWPNSTFTAAIEKEWHPPAAVLPSQDDSGACPVNDCPKKTQLTHSAGEICGPAQITHTLSHSRHRLTPATAAAQAAAAGGLGG